MAKWADYLISKVRYESCNTTRHISHVRVHVDEGDSVGTATVWTRQQVIDAISKGHSFCTITWNATTSKWDQGEKVKIVDRTVRFIKTNPDNTTKDNLENLPEF